MVCTVIYEWSLLLDQASVVKAISFIGSRILLMEFLVASNVGIKTFVFKVIAAGILYLSSKTWIKFAKSVLLHSFRGLKSFIINKAR